MPLAEGSRFNVCIRTETPRALVTAWVIPTEVCAFASRVTVPSAPLSITAPVRDGNLQALTVVHDGGEFMQFAFGQLPPRKVTVLVGNFADPIGSGNAFAPCLGGRDPAARVLADTLDAIVPIAAPILIPLSVDIAVPPTRELQRTTLAHEFGHVIFHELIKWNAPSPDVFAAHWILAIVESLAGGAGGNPDFGASVMNEAVADYFSVQLTGSARRLRRVPLGVGAGAYIGNDFPETYCSSSVAGCMDTNVDGTLAGDPFNDRVSAFSTLLHDMFDDAPVMAGFGHNGGVWVESCSGGTCRPTDALVTLPAPSLFDENIAVPLNVLQIAIRAWLFEPVGGLVFTVPTVMRGVTRALRLAGIDDTSICSLYNAHQPPLSNCGEWFP